MSQCRSPCLIDIPEQQSKTQAVTTAARITPVASPPRYAPMLPQGRCAERGRRSTVLKGGPVRMVKQMLAGLALTWRRRASPPTLSGGAGQRMVLALSRRLGASRHANRGGLPIGGVRSPRAVRAATSGLSQSWPLPDGYLGNDRRRALADRRRHRDSIVRMDHGP